MTDETYQALRDAVNFARSRSIHSRDALRSALIAHGYSAEAIDEAIKAWADYEQSKRWPQ